MLWLWKGLHQEPWPDWGACNVEKLSVQWQQRKRKQEVPSDGAHENPFWEKPCQCRDCAKTFRRASNLTATREDLQGRQCTNAMTVGNSSVVTHSIGNMWELIVKRSLRNRSMWESSIDLTCECLRSAQDFCWDFAFCTREFRVGRKLYKCCKCGIT